MRSPALVKSGIIGDIGRDAQGGLLESPVTVLRVEGGAFVDDRVIVVESAREGR